MVRNPQVLQQFEDARKSNGEPLPLEKIFEWFEGAFAAAVEINPDAARFPSRTEDLLRDPHIQLLARMRPIFSRSNPAA